MICDNCFKRNRCDIRDNITGTIDTCKLFEDATRGGIKYYIPPELESMDVYIVGHCMCGQPVLEQIGNHLECAYCNRSYYGRNFTGLSYRPVKVLPGDLVEDFIVVGQVCPYDGNTLFTARKEKIGHSLICKKCGGKLLSSEFFSAIIKAYRRHENESV